MTRHPSLACVLALVGSAALAQSAAPTMTMRFMTPETALKAAQAALAACRSQDFQVAVAVVDRGGIVQVLLRDRFAGPHTVEMATAKAWTATSFRTPTTELADATQAGRPMSGIRDLPRVVAAGGGVPVDEGGTLFGGIGVSGGPNGEADERCARAGLRAVADDLAL